MTLGWLWLPKTLAGHSEEQQREQDRPLKDNGADKLHYQDRQEHGLPDLHRLTSQPINQQNAVAPTIWPPARARLGSGTASQ